MHPSPSDGVGASDRRHTRPAVVSALAVVPLVVGIVVGVFLGRMTAMGTSGQNQQASPALRLEGVPDVRQSTPFSCGAAALQAVLAYWGMSEREDQLADRLHTTPEHGTHSTDIARVAQEFGLQAEVREGLDLDDLRVALEQGITAIVDVQAWREKVVRPWLDEWEEGHYMVLIGWDESNLYFEDPSLLGSRGFIPGSEFVDRWHDYEGEPPFDATDHEFIHMAIFVRGEKPAPPAALVPVE